MQGNRTDKQEETDSPAESGIQKAVVKSATLRPVFARLRRKARIRSLLAFFMQSVILYLILGPLLSWSILRLLADLFPQLAGSSQTLADGQTGFLPSFWELLLGSPVGFALSLLIDWRKAPLRACLPLRWLTTLRGPTNKQNGQIAPNNKPNRVFYAQHGDSVRMFWGRQRSKKYWFFLSLLLGFAVILGSNLLLDLIHWLFPQLPTYQIDDIDQIFADFAGWQVFLLVVAQPVIFEELVYRGRGYTLLARNWGSGSAMLISSLIFASVHASPVEILSLLPLAFYLGWLRKRSGSLAYTMLVHLQNNGLAFIWQLMAAN